MNRLHSGFWVLVWPAFGLDFDGFVSLKSGEVLSRERENETGGSARDEFELAGDFGMFLVCPLLKYNM